MDTIQVEGILYTKASQLAKHFRYTTDYIGQLCRADKVECKLVGRAWYVSESSLLKHKDARYKEVRINEKTSKINVSLAHGDELISISSRMKTATAKQLQASHSNFLSRLGVSESKYFVDETELLPQPLKRSKPIVPTIPKEIEVNAVDARNVAVRSATKPAKLDFTDLPEVSLRGKLAVEEVEISQMEAPVITLDDIKDSKLMRAIDTLETIDTNPHLEPSRRAIKPVQTFTPQIVAAKAARGRTRFLIPISLAASATLSLFITVAFQSYVIEGATLSAAILFSLEGLQILFAS